MSQDLSETLRTLAETAVRHARGRLKLLQIEVAEERERLVQILQAGLIAAFSALITVHVLLFSLIALAWDTPARYPVLLGVLLALVILTWIAIRRYLIVLNSVSTLFTVSLGELQKDRAAMDEAP